MKILVLNPNTSQAVTDRIAGVVQCIARPDTEKHRVEVAVAAGVVLLLACATIVSGVLTIWANRERARAGQAEADARAVLKFFEEKVLAALRPEGEAGGRGLDVTLREAVEAAEQEIGGSFRDRPLVEASIRHVLGQTLFVLGVRDAAVLQLERAMALTQLQSGPDDAAVLEAMHTLGITYDEAGRSSLAVPLLERVLASRKARLGTNDVDTLRTMTALGGVYRSVGRNKDALPLLGTRFCTAYSRYSTRLQLLHWIRSPALAFCH